MARSFFISLVSPITFFLGILLLMCQPLFSQLDLLKYGRYDSIEVIDGTDTLRNPWAGGLNTPQFYTINLNGDAHPDLFVYDRDGSESRTFINTGNREKTIYRHAPEYEVRFPRMWNYAMIYDYNNDGFDDLFTSASTTFWSGGDFKVYKNISTSRDADSLIFEELKWKSPNDSNTYVDYLTFKFYRGASYWYSNVFCEPGDIPALHDIDSDGDMDILSFGNNSNTITFYRNMSMEFYGVPDSLDFRDSTYCWGRFEESQFKFELFLDACTGIPVKKDHHSGSGARHVGSTIFAHDLNGDSLTDVILGDLSFKTMIGAINGGTRNRARMVSQDTTYPRTTVPIEVDVFPAAYYVETNNDGVKDLVVAPNAYFEFENVNQVHYYKNQDRDNRVSWKFEGKDFLVGSMIDKGTDAYPSFIDINGDSLLDIVAGNYGKYIGNTQYVGSLSLYLNYGSKTDPRFRLISDNYLGINDTGLFPAFGDLDGDGDQDLLVANYMGNVTYFENIAVSPADSCIFQKTKKAFDTINLGIGARPYLYDVNHDSKMDLLVGSEQLSIKYFPNIGTSSAPRFSYLNYSPSFGNIVVSSQFNTVFIANLDSTGKDTVGRKEYLFLGRSDGYIELYSGLDSTGNSNLTKLNESFTYARNVSITGGDITGDGKFDLCYGQQTGGISILLKDGGNILRQPDPIDTIDTGDTTDVVRPHRLPNFNIFPNPTSGLIHLNFSAQAVIENIGKLTVFNTQGMALLEADIQKNMEIDLSQYSNGVYLLAIPSESGIQVFKIIKTKY
ncbi:MAG: T9SS type A sorting domain-containing protein [Flavobacteriales bacterium]|nr:T9SS type A sorting domain-containing protein [Flavobacteriales bacterium]